MFSLCLCGLINVTHTGVFIFALLPTPSARRVDKYLPPGKLGISSILGNTNSHNKYKVNGLICKHKVIDDEWFGIKMIKKNQFNTKWLIFLTGFGHYCVSIKREKSFKDGPKRNIWVRQRWFALVANQAPSSPYIGFPLGQTISVDIHFSTRSTLYISSRYHGDRAGNQRTTVLCKLDKHSWDVTCCYRPSHEIHLKSNTQGPLHPRCFV